MLNLDSVRAKLERAGEHVRVSIKIEPRVGGSRRRRSTLLMRLVKSRMAELRTGRR
jgi:hypothetical protein